MTLKISDQYLRDDHVTEESVKCQLVKCIMFCKIELGHVTSPNLLSDLLSSRH